MTRTGGAGVVSSNTLIHHAPDAGRVPFLIADLLGWLRTSEEHPLIASCVFHYEFEFIHPFADGNGRTRRLWQTLIQSKWRPILKNPHIENVVYIYRHAIAVSGGKVGCTPFFEFFLGVIAEMLTTKETTQMTTQEIILYEIRRNPKVTRGELAALAGVSHNTFCRSSSAQGCAPW
ncbi:Fic family protein [Alistipes putredinis]|uniref:Fic family protein n=1 Tax=Alistipes putredinis TaxID=28117 RepID=UPI00242B8C8E|nr:Fic family protein [Alistipes putredinis]